MTIALSLKINDGVILAADSASTLITPDSEVFNVYNNVNKIFNLQKGYPIGLITWGAGNIGTTSIDTLVKDLREHLQGEIGFSEKGYTVRDVAVSAREFIYEKHYVEHFKEANPKPVLGFIVAGYSPGKQLAEEYRIETTSDGECPPPKPVRASVESSGLTWSGEGEAISRLILGFGTGLPSTLIHKLGVAEDQIEQAVEVLRSELAAPLVVSAMPLQDAVDLARFLVETTIKFSRYSPGAQTVGGPIEIAAISKHEGFKWIERKHYYSARLNP